ncbi:MAG: ABC transporter permease [Actinomycetota bacterium]
MSATNPSASLGTTAARTRHAWDLVTHLVGREFRLRYRRAILGWLWSLGTPLARLTILTFVFTRILPLGIENYGVFVFTGLISWQWFSAGLSSATSSAIDRRDLLFRPGLSRTAVPIVSVLTDGLDYFSALPVLALFLVLGDGIPLTALALPVILAVQLMLTLGLGFALCSANVYLRDVHLFVDLATLLGWYITPIFYRPRFVPEGSEFILQLNPMAHLLKAYRAILMDGRLPELGPFLVLTAVCAAVLVIGYLIYRATSPVFIDEL